MWRKKSTIVRHTHALATWCFMQSKVENKVLFRCVLTAMGHEWRDERTKIKMQSTKLNLTRGIRHQNKIKITPDRERDIKYISRTLLSLLCHRFCKIIVFRVDQSGRHLSFPLFSLSHSLVSCLAWENQFYFAINRFDLKEFIEKSHSTWLQTHTNLHTQANSFIAVEAQIKRIFFDSHVERRRFARKISLKCSKCRNHLACQRPRTHI